MTAKETLNRIIDRAVVNVPPNYRNDFQRKLPDCQPYIISLQAMEEYATRQVQEVKEERDKAVELLDECRPQLEYLDKRFGTATTPNILSRVNTFLDSLNNNHDRQI